MDRARDLLLYAMPVLALVAVALAMSLGEGGGSGTERDDHTGAAEQSLPTPTSPGPPPVWATDPWGDVAPMPTPGPNDWLSVHSEPGQPFDRFVRWAPSPPGGARTTLFLQPLGSFAGDDAPEPETLRRFAEAFFGVETEVLPVLQIDLEHVTWRDDPHLGHRQLLTGDLLDLLRAERPERAYCVLGVTMEDLYPGPSWNYVFGQASLSDRVAVYSFARYRPSFWGEKVSDPRRLVLRRSCKVLAHETAHAFGIRHCTAHLCLMNGSNHLAESDSRPLHLCSEDLRKLQWVVGFDVMQRYRRLVSIYEELGFDDEVVWIRGRLGHLGDTGESTWSTVPAAPDAPATRERRNDR